MPFYEYECEACNHQFEVYHGMNETPEIKCETCQGKTRKVLFAPSVVFKGSGFYATEYGKSTHNNPKKSSSSSSTTETKPAKTETPTASTETKTADAAAPAATGGGDSKKAA